ncbi:Toll-like receptor 3 [Mactra antiquata]
MASSSIRIIIFLLMIKCVAGTKCRFHGVIADCSYTNLREIPTIPGNIEQLIFRGNDLGSVTFETFKNVENPRKIWKLILTANRIVNITKDAFKNFTHLSFLELSSNQVNVKDLKELLLNMSETRPLYKLYMEHMGTGSINEETFSLLKKTLATNLFLESNQLVKFTTKTLSRLEGVEFLDLDNNKLTEFTLTTMNKLRALRISHNKLPNVPNFCDGNSTNSFTKNLKNLFLNYNYISSISNDTFRCVRTLKKLQIANNVINTYPSMLLSSLKDLTYFDVSANAGHGMKIYPLAFASPTLTFLKIGFNGNALDVLQSIPDTFKGLPILQKLELGYINMMQLTDKNVSDLFAPVTTLDTLHCFRCSLQCDLKSVIGNKPNLTNVNLKSNYFQAINPGLFTANSKINKLFLGMNKISHVSLESLPLTFLNNLSVLDLSKNPFICDCKLAWFIDWLNTANKSHLQYYPDGYTCASPSKWANRRLEEVDFTYLECHPFTTPEWFGMIGGPLIVVLIILALIVYRNRWNIKHYIYLLRKRREYAPLRGDEFVYAAFVAYNKSVFMWVKNFLIPFLEGEHGLKLCVHERDFPVGGFINDNILERMRESKKIILVLSNSFATSEWCMFELKVAHSMHIEDNVEVIVILMEEIKAKNMNNSMKVLLQNTTYLEWTDDNVGQELFITKLKDAMGVNVNG